MKAMVYSRAGSPEDVLKCVEMPQPKPDSNQVLVAVKASTLNMADYGRFAASGNGLNGLSLFTRIQDIVQHAHGRPLGGEVAGIAVQVGKNVVGICEGDEVFGKTPGIFPSGGWAEYALLDRRHVCIKPPTLTFGEASVLPVACETALGALRAAKVGAGDEVMVYGASGGVGGYAVQIAKAMGATVTGVCSTRNVAMAYSIGCDNVIDYRTGEFTKADRTFDAILGINGCNPMKSYLGLLKADGILVVVGNARQAMKALLASPFSRRISAYASPISAPKDCLPYISELVQEGKIKPFIDRVYPMRDVAAAVRYAVSEHVQGKVALRVDFS